MPAFRLCFIGIFREPSGVTRGFAELGSSLWSYNRRLELWEPVITPWQLLVKFDQNPNVTSREGVEPGTQLDVKSTGGAVHITIAHAAVGAILDLLTDWQVGAGTGQMARRSRALAGADGLTVDTTVTNTLDETAYLQLDYGDRKEVVVLPKRSGVPIKQPMPQPPVSHRPVLSQLVPPVRLLVDVLEGQLLAGYTGTGSAPELFVQVDLVGKAALKGVSGWRGQANRAVYGVAAAALPLAQPQLQPNGFGLWSRAIVVHAQHIEGPAAASGAGIGESASSSGLGRQQGATSTAGESAGAAGTPVLRKSSSSASLRRPSQQQSLEDDGEEGGGLSLAWNERFMVALPSQLVEYLLAPAPGDNPFAGVTAELRLSVWDGTGDGGMSTMLFSTAVPMTYDWLLQQLRAAMKHRQVAAAAGAVGVSGSSGAAKGGSVGSEREVLGTQQEVYLYDSAPAGEGSGTAGGAVDGSGGGASAGGGAEGEGQQAQQPAMKLKLRLSVDDSQVSGAYDCVMLLLHALALPLAAALPPE